MKTWSLALSAALLCLFIFASQDSSAQTKQPVVSLQDYAGRYEVDPQEVENFIFDITLEKAELWIKPSHVDKRKLVPQSPDIFLISELNIPVKFNRDQNGKVVSFTVQTPMMFEGKSVSPRKIVLPQPSVKGNTEFRLKGYADARIVALAGTFNDWNQSQLLFARESDEWVCRIDLAPGKYTYKFIVDGNWLVDPANPNTEDDERGITNSVVVVKAK